MSESMIERVARALAVSAGGRMTGPGQSVATKEFAWEEDGGHINRYVEAHWKEHVHAATFAIEAMREPTEAMSAAAMETKGQMTYSDVWIAMIDTALSEKP